MENDLRTLALTYLEAVGKKDYKAVEELLTPDLSFVGPVTTRSTARDYLGALVRLGAIHVRNEPKRLFVDGQEVCAIYDFVTDTPAGTLPVIEWLRFEGKRISSIRLYYDRLPWKGVLEEMSRRTGEAMA